jgi:hypothetical protein
MIRVTKGHEPDRLEIGVGSWGLSDMARAALLMPLGVEQMVVLDFAANESRPSARARKDGTCLA